MTKALPKISIIVPVYNGELTIGQALTALINQDYPKDLVEIIVVDNNSTDDSAAIVKKFPIIYTVEKDIQSVAAARNKGAALAKGEILVFFDADGIVKNNWLKNLIKGHENPKIGAFGGINTFQIKENTIAFNMQEGEWLSVLSQFPLPKDKIFYQLGGNAGIRKEAFERLGGFDITMKTSEDFDLFYRLQAKLPYKVTINTDAIIYNKTRSWKSLLKREYWIGFGDARFCQKFQLKGKNIFLIFLKNLKITLIGIFIIFINLLSIKPWADKKRKILTILFDRIMQWNNLFGRIGYFLGIHPQKTANNQNTHLKTIAYYSNTLSLGGSEVYLKDILNNINHKKYNIIFISPFRHPLREWLNSEFPIKCIDISNLFHLYDSENADKKYLKNKKHPLRILARNVLPSSIKLFLGTIKEIIYLKKLFRKNEIDLIHFNDTGCEPPVIAARLAGIKHIVGTFHVEPSYDKEKMDWVRRLIEYFSTRCLDKGISVSNAVRKSWILRTGVDADKIIVIYNGIDFEKLKSLKIHKPSYIKEFNCEETDQLICVPARLHPMKGHKYLLAAIEEHFQLKNNIKFLFVGDGPLRKEIEETIKQKNLSNIRLLGFRKDVAQIMSISDLIVLPSVALEALPYVLIEAMACSKPIVATDFSGIPEIVEHNVTGILVPRKDPTALALAIYSILKNPDLAQSMGMLGKARAETMFTQDRMLEETFTLYESLLHGK